MRIGNCCSRGPLGGATQALRERQRGTSQGEMATELERRNQATAYDCICV
jgi:hypothetical protein